MVPPAAVVIGAGPNGLVAANLLADAGWSVTVLEANAEPGGAVRSGEITAPGFVSDRFSSFYPLGVASPVFRALDLERWGLRWRRSQYAVAHPTLDGRAAYVGDTVDVTARSLDAYAPGDGDAWRTMYAIWERAGTAIVDALMHPFPPVADAVRVAALLGPRTLAEFTRFALLPMRRLADEHFRGEGARLLLAGNAAHSDVVLSAALSGFYGYMLVALAQAVGFPTVEGGSSRLIEALVRRLESRGGALHCNRRVTDVIVRGGRAVAVRTGDGDEFAARDAVLADVSAPSLYFDLVGASSLPPSYVQQLQRFEWDPATVKIDWALDRPVPWTADAARHAGTVHLAASLDALTRAEAELAMGLVPAEPFVLMGQPDVADPTRCPPGTGTLWGYTHVPQRLKGDAGTDGISGRWDAADAQRMADRVEAQIERFAPGFREIVRARHVATPPMLEAADANLRNGAVGGGTAQLHQQLVFRPALGLGGARTPIDNLYLASASAHPGGGVHGACGANAAHAALTSYRRRRFVAALTPGRP